MTAGIELQEPTSLPGVYFDRISCHTVRSIKSGNHLSGQRHAFRQETGSAITGQACQLQTGD
jgi:hypothetical protein